MVHRRWMFCNKCRIHDNIKHSSPLRFLWIFLRPLRVVRGINLDKKKNSACVTKHIILSLFKFSMRFRCSLLFAPKIDSNAGGLRGGFLGRMNPSLIDAHTTRQRSHLVRVIT